MVLRVAEDEVCEELLRLIKQTTPAFDIVAEKEKKSKLGSGGNLGSDRA
jgi:hypothetical protein